MDLKISDVAELLNVSSAEVETWLKEDQIPSYQLGNEAYFNREEIEDWIMEHHRQNGSKGVSTLAPLGINSAGALQYSLYRALHQGFVLHEAEGETKEEIIAWAVKEMAQNMNLDAPTLCQLLLEREKLMPTALNRGIGVPHTRDFLLEGEQDAVVVVFPKKPIEYGALDHIPVHVMFFLLASSDKNHLHLISKLAHLASQEAAVTFLKSKPSKKEILQFVKTWEAQINQNV